MDDTNKAILKIDFPFTQVPFCLVHKNGQVLFSGDPKDMNLEELKTVVLAPNSAVAIDKFVLDEDF